MKKLFPRSRFLVDCLGLSPYRTERPKEISKSLIFLLFLTASLNFLSDF